MRPLPYRRRSLIDRRSAFSLLELLISITILALLLVMLLSMVNGATSLWRTNENRVDSYREARAAINLIVSDLSSIYTSPNVNYLANPNLTSFYTQEDKLPKTPVKKDGMDGSIFFLTATPSAAQEIGKNKSDLCTVGYFLGFDKTSLTGRGTESYNLYRYYRSSDETFNALTGGMTGNGQPQNGDILTDVEIETAPTSTSAEVLAKNITGFTVAAYTIPPPATAGGTYGKPVKFRRSDATPLPDMVEITLTAISNEAAKRFSKPNGNTDRTAWEDPTSTTRKQNDRTFKTRIFLAGASQLKREALEEQFPAAISSNP